MYMNISDPHSDDVTLQEVAHHAGCTVKTVRRAIQAGQLSRRYVMSPRGPQLVFTPAEVDAWIGERTGRRRTRQQPGQGCGGAATADWSRLSEQVAQLQALLAQSCAAITALSAQVVAQHDELAEVRSAVGTLTARLDVITLDASATGEHANPVATSVAAPSAGLLLRPSRSRV